MTNKQFAVKFGRLALAATNGSGIFAETALTQAALESDSGESGLAKIHNNYFGIKADISWTGPKTNQETREVYEGKSYNIKSNFRVYSNPYESFRDYVKFLKENPRYEKAGVFKAKTPAEQLKAISAAGYATGTNYYKVLTDILKNIQPAMDGLIQEIVKKKDK